MKELHLKLYSFDELSEDVKHKVCERERESENNFGYFCQESDAEERYATLDKFCDIFGIEYKIDYDHQYRFITWRFKDSHGYVFNDKKICGKYLWRFLDKYYYDIRSRKWFSRCWYKRDGKYVLDCRIPHSKDRYSKIIWEEQNCPFTGMCYDCDILDKIFDWYKNPDWKISLHDLFDNCFSHYMKLWREEDDYRMSDENIGNMISANWEDKLYFEDGAEYNGPDLDEFIA